MIELLALCFLFAVPEEDQVQWQGKAENREQLNGYIQNEPGRQDGERRFEAAGVEEVLDHPRQSEEDEKGKKAPPEGLIQLDEGKYQPKGKTSDYVFFGGCRTLGEIVREGCQFAGR